jgi:hypothetical protein
MRAGAPEDSVLSPTLYNMYINDAPQTIGFYLALLADDTSLYAKDRKEVLLSENSSAVSAHWRPSVSAGILKYMKIRLRGFTFLAVVDHLSPILY